MKTWWPNLCSWVGMAPTAKNLSELWAWQLANEQCAVISEITETGPCRRDRKWWHQIRDSSAAVAPLIAEGFIRFSPPEFAKYLRWAIAEIKETQTHLITAQARRYFSEQQLDRAWRISKRTMAATSRLLKSKLAQIERHKSEEKATRT
jgi:four helix bundle protein